MSDEWATQQLAQQEAASAAVVNYEIRRTVHVRPEDYAKPYGCLRGTASSYEDAIARAQGSGRLGYPARVISVRGDVRRCVWVRP